MSTGLVLAIAYAVFVEQRERQIAAQQELDSAREVQQMLIPEALPEVAGYAIQSVYQPAKEVGGDLFQIIPQEDKSVIVALGDVSGKGLKGAMNVSLIVGTLRTLAEFEHSPAAILAVLNRRLFGRMQGGFATAVVLKLGVLGDCALANAGHLRPFLNSTEITLEPSLPLGIDTDAGYPDRNVVLNDDDRLTLYTDGVLEATNSEGELYGFERVAALLADRPNAESIAKTALAFGQEDDITVLTITRLPTHDAYEAATVSLATS
jgi:serine phosphatase RsbU (regulator of sigma subunit)